MKYRWYFGGLWLRYLDCPQRDRQFGTEHLHQIRRNDNETTVNVGIPLPPPAVVADPRELTTRGRCPLCCYVPRRARRQLLTVPRKLARRPTRSPLAKSSSLLALPECKVRTDVRGHRWSLRQTKTIKTNKHFCKKYIESARARQKNDSAPADYRTKSLYGGDLR